MSPPTTTYAKGTAVSVSKSRGEVRDMLSENKADDIGFTERKAAGVELVTFSLKGNFFRIAIPVPQEKDFQRTSARWISGRGTTPGRTRGPKSAEDNRMQAEREVWRLFVLALKAKFELIRAGHSTAEIEFMAFIVLPHGSGTVGEAVARELQVLRDGGRFGGALLLGMGERTPEDQ